MIDRLPIIALLVLASMPAASDAAAPASRNYSITSFDRIRIDGPYKVELRTNVSPYARASGSPLALDGLSIGVEGNTLVVTSNGFNDRTFLGGLGYRHSEALKVTERFTRHDLGHMTVEITSGRPAITGSSQGAIRT